MIIIYNIFLQHVFRKLYFVSKVFYISSYSQFKTLGKFFIRLFKPFGLSFTFDEPIDSDRIIIFLTT
jgi:hypothetical protein